MRTLTPLLLISLAANTTACGGGLSTKQRAEAKKRLSNLREAANKQAAPWKKAIAEADRKLMPRGDLGPCPIDVKVEAPDATDKQAMVAYMSVGLEELRRAEAGESPFRIVPRAKLQKTTAPRVRLARIAAKKLEALLAKPSEMEHSGYSPKRLMAELRKLSAPDWWSWDVLVVVDAKKEHLLGVDTQAGTFKPNTAQGWSFLYSYKEKRVVCMGRWTARNSALVYTSGDLADPSRNAHFDVAQDLEVQILRAGRNALVRSGPPKAKAPSPRRAPTTHPSPSKKP